MTTKSAILSGFLLVWMAGSTYWYVCKIKKDCEKAPPAETLVKKQVEITKDTIKTEELKTETDEREALLKEKLSKGILLSGFPYNSAGYNQYSDEFNNFVKDLKEYLDSHPGEAILITGYTDNKGSETKNLQLSEQRALTLKSKLLEQGINEAQIVVKAGGESNPLASNDTEAGRYQNRRVEMKLITQ